MKKISRKNGVFLWTALAGSLFLSTTLWAQESEESAEIREIIRQEFEKKFPKEGILKKTGKTALNAGLWVLKNPIKSAAIAAIILYVGSTLYRGYQQEGLSPKAVTAFPDIAKGDYEQAKGHVTGAIERKVQEEKQKVIDELQGLMWRRPKFQ